MKKNAVLALVSCWLGWTVLVDFFVVPTVFGTIRDFFNAGELGIEVFSKLNSLELILSALSIGLLTLDSKQTGQGKFNLVLLSVASLIVLFYFAFLTPKIVELTELWKIAEAKNQVGISGVADIQQEHQYFHKMYVRIDSVKLLLLATVTGLMVFKREQASA